MNERYFKRSAAVVIAAAIVFSVMTGINPIIKMWKLADKMTEFEYRHNPAPKNTSTEESTGQYNPEFFSDDSDDDYDGISDKSEVLLGLDPYRSYSDGKTPDGDRVFNQTCSFELGDQFSDYYDITIETESSGYIYDEAELKVSDLNDYYMDDRKGRAINIYKFGEIVEEGVFTGIVNKYAMEGPVLDVVYNSERKLNSLKICFNIKNSSPENYMIFKSVKEEDAKGSEYNILVPVATEYDEKTAYYTDTDPDSSNIGTYVLVNIIRLSSFHDLINTGYADDILESGIITDDYLREFDYEFVNGDPFSDYSDTEDPDGDGISSKKEMYLGLDPDNSETDGTPDSEVKYLQTGDESMFREINEANSEYDFYLEAVSGEKISDLITVGPCDNEALFRNDMNGRLVSVSSPDIGRVELIYGSLVHPSAIVGDIVQVSVSDTDKVTMVKAGFVLPDNIPEEDIQYYRVATSASSEFGGQYMLANAETRRSGRKVFFIYSRDVKSFALVDMRKLEAFTLENNGMTYEEECKTGILYDELADNYNIEEKKH